MWMIPLVSRVWILQKVWTAQPKWWPQWTKGSWIDLNTNKIMYGDAKEILMVSFSFMAQAPKHLDWCASEHLMIQKRRSWSCYCLPWMIEGCDCREDVKLMDCRGKEGYLYLAQGGLDVQSGNDKKILFSKGDQKNWVIFSKLAN